MANAHHALTALLVVIQGSSTNGYTSSCASEMEVLT